MPPLVDFTLVSKGDAIIPSAISPRKRKLTKTNTLRRCVRDNASHPSEQIGVDANPVNHPSLKGISSPSRHFLKKQVMAVVMFMPMSVKNSSASALSFSSMRMESVVVMANAPLVSENDGILQKMSCVVNAA